MAATPKPLRTAKKAGATRMRVAGKLDDVKRGGKPPRPATVSRYKKEGSKRLGKMLKGGTVPEREARGEKGVRAKFNAESAGMAKQMRKETKSAAKKSVVAPGFSAKKTETKKPVAPATSNYAGKRSSSMANNGAYLSKSDKMVAKKAKAMSYSKNKKG